MAFKKILFFSAILLATALVFACYYFHQPVATYAKAPLMDGNQYSKIYHYLRTETTDYEVIFPFNSRIAVPGLAVLLPTQNAITAFQIINFVFTLLSSVVLGMYWRQLHLPIACMGWGFFWLLFHWTGMIRLNAYDPITVDVPLYLFQTLFLLIVLHQKWHYLWWLSPLATLQKESFPVLLLVLLVYGWFYNRQMPGRPFPVLLLVGCLIVSIATKYAVNFFFPPTNPGSSLRTVLYFVKETTLHPFRLVRWLTGVWVAFGGLLALAAQQWIRQGGFGKIKDTILRRPVWLPLFANTNTDLLFLFSITYLGLSLLAGGDFTRIAFLGFPFIATYCLLLVRNTNVWLLVLACLFSLPLMHLFQPIPDQAIYWQAFAEWYSEFASAPVVWLLFLYGLLVFTIFWGLNRFQTFQ